MPPTRPAQIRELSRSDELRDLQTLFALPLTLLPLLLAFAILVPLLLAPLLVIRVLRGALGVGGSIAALLRLLDSLRVGELLGLL